MYHEQFRCTRCNSRWSITKEDGVEGEPQCPVCTVKEVYDKKAEITKLQQLLSSYRKVFQDLGINNIKVSEGE